MIVELVSDMQIGESEDGKEQEVELDFDSMKAHFVWKMHDILLGARSVAWCRVTILLYGPYAI